MESHSVTYHPTQVNSHRLTPARQAGTRFTYPGGIEGWVDLGDLLHPRWFTRLQTVTHPSTSRAQCRLTSLIKPTPLTTTLRRHNLQLILIPSILAVQCETLCNHVVGLLLTIPRPFTLTATTRIITSRTDFVKAFAEEFESKAPEAEEMLDRVVCSRERFSFLGVPWK